MRRLRRKHFPCCFFPCCWGFAFGIRHFEFYRLLHGRENFEGNPQEGTTRYFFNKRGRAAGSRDPEDNANSMTYDGEDRVVTRATGANETTAYTYDAAHNLRASSPLAPWRQQPLRSAKAHQP